MLLQPPWTGIGRIQSDVNNIKSLLHNKADSHEIHEANRKLDSLEHSLREISSNIDEFLFRLQEVEEKINKQ